MSGAKWKYRKYDEKKLDECKHYDGLVNVKSEKAYEAFKRPAYTATSHNPKTQK